MDTILYVRTVGALILVLGLIFAALWAVRRFGLGGMGMRPLARRRLALVEALPLDAKHRLLLVRRDGIEHLLLVGGGTDLVVEGQITPPPPEDIAP